MAKPERAARAGRRETHYAVIGWPLDHSMSPVIHNASFNALGLPCRFEPLPLPPREFEKFMVSLPSSPRRGLAVTIPYKTAILRHCRLLDADTRRIGAANTIRIADDGALEAFNTDAAAAGRSLSEAGVKIEGAKVVVVGAGGAARAVCFQMLVDGAGEIEIANRTLSRAERLMEELRRAAPEGASVRALPLEREPLAAAIAEADILINTTPVGMFPRIDESPVPPDILREGCAVFDVVYNPLETRLLAAAREKGAKAIAGADMLVWQAAEQERIWLGVDPPVGLMREALLRELGRSP